MRRILILVVILVGAGGFGFWYWFIRDTAPPAATLAPRDTVKPPASGPNGVYAVKADDKTTFAGFRIKEKFTIASHVAVVRTPKVTGTLTVAGSTISGVAVTADLSALESKDDQPPGVPGVENRVGNLQDDGLQIATFPDAKFALTKNITLPSAPAVGVEVDVSGAGKLTLHGVTNSVTIPLKARWNGALVDVTGTLPIHLADYKITPPTRSFVQVGGDGTLEFELTFAK